MIRLVKKRKENESRIHIFVSYMCLSVFIVRGPKSPETKRVRHKRQ